MQRCVERLRASSSRSIDEKQKIERGKRLFLVSVALIAKQRHMQNQVIIDRAEVKGSHNLILFPFRTITLVYTGRVCANVNQ